MSASDTPGPDEVRILNSISDGKAKASGRGAAAGASRKSGRTAAIVVALLLILGGGAAAVFYASSPAGDSKPVVADNKPLAQLASAEASPAGSSAAPVIDANAAAPSGDAGKPAAPADTALINDSNAPAGQLAAGAPASEGTAAPTRGQDQLTSALEDGVKPPPATLKNALEAKPEKPAKKQAAHEEKKKKATKADPKNDSDVDLIKALVARSAEVDKKRATREAGGSSQKLAQGNAASSSKPANARNTDIVERDGNESTESLLQRCRALGFMEGEFCRWRICSGRWDSDPACKVPNSN